MGLSCAVATTTATRRSGWLCALAVPPPLPMSPCDHAQPAPPAATSRETENRNASVPVRFAPPMHHLTGRTVLLDRHSYAPEFREATLCQIVPRLVCIACTSFWNEKCQPHLTLSRGGKQPGAKAEQTTYLPLRSAPARRSSAASSVASRLAKQKRTTERTASPAHRRRRREWRHAVGLHKIEAEGLVIQRRVDAARSTERK